MSHKKQKVIPSPFFLLVANLTPSYRLLLPASKLQLLSMKLETHKDLRGMKKQNEKPLGVNFLSFLFWLGQNWIQDRQKAYKRRGGPERWAV